MIEENEYGHDNSPEAVEQRGQRGFSISDTWSFDGYLARVIAGGVAELRKREIGYPMSMYPEHLRDIGAETTPEDDEAAHKRWNEILDKIEAGFKAYADEDDIESEGFKEAMSLFAEHFPYLWD